MSTWVTMIFIILASFQPLSGELGQSSDREVTLDQFKWKNRLIILAADSADVQKLTEQKALLARENTGIRDRDLRLIEVFTNGRGRIDGEPISSRSVAAIRDNLQLPPGAFRVLLIGKDGTVKLRSAEVVTISEVFSLIDSMPMRRQEIREKEGGKVRPPESKTSLP
jgi:hypothetical protein